MVPTYTINLRLQRLHEINISDLLSEVRGHNQLGYRSIKSPLIVLYNDGYVPIQKMPPKAVMTTFVTWSSKYEINFTPNRKFVHAMNLAYNRLKERYSIFFFFFFFLPKLSFREHPTAQLIQQF